MRLSKQDPTDPTKRRHFEISIDSPFHLLACQATHANTTLPAYDDPQSGGPSSTGSCRCPPFRRDSSRTAQQTPALQRNPTTAPPPPFTPSVRPPAVRYPTMNPPPFSAEPDPLPLVTPPPRYDSVIDSNEGLAGYFSRLAEATEDDDTDDDSTNGSARGRPPLLPLTPGGRVARSMDERRTW